MVGSEESSPGMALKTADLIASRYPDRALCRDSQARRAGNVVAQGVSPGFRGVTGRRVTAGAISSRRDERLALVLHVRR